MNIIILEGPDGSGKSTLAAWLSNQKGFLYHHEGAPTGPLPEGTVEHYTDVMADVVARAKELGAPGVVFDRLAISEVVYAPATKRPPRVTLDQAHFFRRNIAGIFILCLPRPDVCFQNWKSSTKSELFSDDRVFWETYARYAHLALDNMFDVLFDYSGSNYPELWSTLVEIFKPRQSVARHNMN